MKKFLMTFYKHPLNYWNMNDIYNKIAEKVPIRCKVSPPNVVILEPEKSPNCDKNVHNACM
jgi:hypothetical protein